MRKNIAILGSTGSIGTQTLQVAAAHREDLEVRALVAHRNWELLAAQAREFEPDCVVIADEAFYAPLREALEGTDVKVYAGAEAVKQVAAQRSVDVVVAAMVGFSGLEPTVAAIRAGKTVALANKETLVVAGELITRLAEEHRTAIVPVDSEHSAIFQCLVGEGTNRAEKLILTASGGPFRGRTREELRGVTAADALRHPNWRMGAKVTVDSASLMNKGFEVMEACWLFGMKPEEVEVVVHPQSVVHSMVQFEDGCVKAQLGVPDMRLPIQYALSYPWRWEADWGRLDWRQLHELTFEEPDRQTFRNLDLAYEAMRRGGNAPCVLNAANEVAVAAFLEGRCTFLGMPEVVERTLERVEFVGQPSLEALLEIDGAARRVAEEELGRLNG